MGKKPKKRKRPPKRRLPKLRGLQLRIKKTEQPRETESFQLSPNDLPKLSFRGELLGTASWFPEFLVFPRQRTHMAVYRIEKDETQAREYQFLAHIKRDKDWDRVYAGDSPILLLTALMGNEEAPQALTKLLGIELFLNDPEDFHVLVELTRPLRL